MSEIKLKPYRSVDFSYSIRPFNYGNVTKYFINVLITCYPIHYHLAQKNDFNMGADTEAQAKKKIQNILRKHCIGTPAEMKMKALPIFEDGYQETLF